MTFPIPFPYQNFMENQKKTAMVDVCGRENELEFKTYDFGYFEEKIRAFSSLISSKGLEKGQTILLTLPNGPSFAIAFFSLLRLGLVPIPLDPALKKEELDFIARDSLAAGLIDLGAQEGLLNLHLYPSSVKQVPHGLQGAYWLYTRNSEGCLQGVVHGHQSFAAHPMRALLWQGASPHDVIFNTVGFHESYGLTCGFLDPWLQGLPCITSQIPLKPALLRAVVEKTQVSVFMSEPSVYTELARYLSEQDCGFEPVRVGLSSGERLPGEVNELFISATGIEIYEGFGMAEHSVFLIQPFGQKIKEGSFGQPLPGLRLAILKDDLSHCQSGEVGQLALHRTNLGLMLGYAGVPQEKTFKEDWFLTGKRAYIDREGDVFMPY